MHFFPQTKSSPRKAAQLHVQHRSGFAVIKACSYCVRREFLNDYALNVRNAWMRCLHIKPCLHWRRHHTLKSVDSVPPYRPDCWNDHKVALAERLFTTTPTRIAAFIGRFLCLLWSSQFAECLQPTDNETTSAYQIPPSVIGSSLSLLPVLGTVCRNTSRPHLLCLFSEVASRLSSSGVPSHDFYRNFCSACAVKVVIFGHFNRSFFNFLKKLFDHS